MPLQDLYTFYDSKLDSVTTNWRSSNDRLENLSRNILDLEASIVFYKGSKDSAIKCVQATKVYITFFNNGNVKKIEVTREKICNTEKGVIIKDYNLLTDLEKSLLKKIYDVEDKGEVGISSLL